MRTWKFGIGDVVRHRKGTEYTIVGTPHDHRLEATGKPAYAYKERVPYKGVRHVWVRVAWEMEDGRFTLVRKSRIGLRGERALERALARQQHVVQLDCSECSHRITSDEIDFNAAVPDACPICGGAWLPTKRRRR